MYHTRSTYYLHSSTEDMGWHQCALISVMSLRIDKFEEMWISALLTSL